jgi:hypothetical protein
MPQTCPYLATTAVLGLSICLSVSSGVVPGVIVSAGAQTQQRTFASPEAGIEALIDALRRNASGALESVLGPGSRELIDSGDPVADAAARDEFLTAYDIKSGVLVVGEDERRLLVGESDWSLPIPLIRQGSMWRFDIDRGRDELISRRVGRNETNAIEASQAFVDAQQEYASADRDSDDILEYAHRFISTSGMKDGLYWPAQDGEEESPLGPLFAEARSDGYQIDSAEPGSPYYGYRYRMLMSQGAAAMGGAYDYLVAGNMISGFAMIAYPDQYGVSGVMSFLVNHDGIVYQKDLGAETPAAAAMITAFNPDDTWQRAAVQTPVASTP